MLFNRTFFFFFLIYQQKFNIYYAFMIMIMALKIAIFYNPIDNFWNSACVGE